ncbi:MscL family protein [Streptomyces clavifer]|uniref:MscL family protein n=1 Tax=Streptomyces clavifer TaxID=68188 RepID=UPI00382D5EE7
MGQCTLRPPFATGLFAPLTTPAAEGSCTWAGRGQLVGTFRALLTRGNVSDIAGAVVIGAAFTHVVKTDGVEILRGPVLSTALPLLFTAAVVHFPLVMPRPSTSPGGRQRGPRRRESGRRWR